MTTYYEQNLFFVSHEWKKKDIIPKPYISHGPYLTNNTYSLIFIQLYVQYAGVDSVLTVSSLEAPP